MPCLGRCNAPKRGSGGRFLEGGWFYQVKLAIYHKPDYARRIWGAVGAIYLPITLLCLILHRPRRYSLPYDARQHQ